MTEDQTESIDEIIEKEEKRKIRVVEQIDNRLAIQGQAYIKGQLKEALSVAYEIIELAKSEDLNSFVKDQEDLITRIKKLLKEKEEKEKEKIKQEQLRLKQEKIKKLKTELERLDGVFTKALDNKDYIKTHEIIEKAKIFLETLDDKKIKQYWEDLEKKSVKAVIRENLIKKFESFIEESITLREKHQFNELKLKITNLIKEFEDNEIKDYLDDLKQIELDVINTEKEYLKKLEKIETLVKKIKDLQNKGNYKEGISRCERLIELADSLHKEEIAKEHLNLIKEFENNIRLKELQDSLKALNQEGLLFLKKGDIESSLERFKTIKKSLQTYLA
ncbi:MAG: hypothetical protein ACFE9Z_11575 [Promethearchaeota archaeon]